MNAGSDHRIKALAHTPNPGIAVTNLGRAVFAADMAFNTLGLDDLLAAARCWRRLLVDRFNPITSGLVDHEGDGTLQISTA